jgi:uncharacterized membrane protein YbhN (UPF0104 family)
MRVETVGARATRGRTEQRGKNTESGEENGSVGEQGRGLCEGQAEPSGRRALPLRRRAALPSGVCASSTEPCGGNAEAREGNVPAVERTVPSVGQEPSGRPVLPLRRRAALPPGVSANTELTALPLGVSANTELTALPLGVSANTEPRGGNAGAREGDVPAVERAALSGGPAEPSGRPVLPSRRYAERVEVFALPAGVPAVPAEALAARTRVLAARTEALAARAEMLEAREELASADGPPVARTGPAVSPARIGVIVAGPRPAAGPDAPRRRTAFRGALARLNSPAVRTHFGTVAGVAILAALLWRLGTGVFLDGLRRIDAPTLVVAVGIGLVTTVFSAWRWALVARGLGIRLPLAPAVADYYRALFLNAALPGGVLGDVHRAVRHGQSSGDLGRGVRAVVLERTAGQAVLAVVGAAVLLTMPSPVLADARHFAPLLGLAALGALAVVLALRMNRAAPSRRGRALRAGLAEAREGLLSRRNGPGVAVSSAVVLAGHIGMFVLAARVAGSAASVAALLPLAVLALLAMGLPLNIGGFGPREGVTAWAFGAAGLGASSGLAVAVVYGVLSFVAALPGALVLAARWYTGLRGTRDAAGTAVTDPEPWHAPDGVYPRPASAVLAVPSAEVSIEKYVPKESAKLASSSFPFSADPREGRPMTPESV